MIRPMVKVYTTTTMAPAIMGNGMKMSNKVLVYKSGPMDHPMKGKILSIL